MREHGRAAEGGEWWVRGACESMIVAKSGESCQGDVSWRPPCQLPGLPPAQRIRPNLRLEQAGEFERAALGVASTASLTAPSPGLGSQRSVDPHTIRHSAAQFFFLSTFPTSSSSTT